MKYLSIYTPDPRRAGPPSREHMDRMGKLVEDSLKAGTLVTTGALLPLATAGARLRRADGAITVVDGPFTESKELVCGFAILEASGREHAIELVREFLAIAGGGETAVHQIMDAGDGPSRR